MVPWIETRTVAAEKANADEEEMDKIEEAHALALKMEAERVKATRHYIHLIRGMDKNLDAREIWRA